MMKTIYQELKSIINQNILYSFLIIASLICFLLLVECPIDDIYECIRVMPLVYIAVLLMFIRPRKIIGISTSLLIVMYFIKICIVAVVCAYGNFYSQISVEFVTKNWKLACFYLGFEWFLVALFINITTKHFIKKLINNKTAINRIATYKVFMIIGVVICLSIYFLFPNMEYKIRPFFLTDELGARPEPGKGGPFYIFRTFFELVKPMCFFYAFMIAEKKQISSVKKRIIELALIALCALFMTEFRMLSLTAALAMLVYLLICVSKHNNNNLSIIIKITVAIGLILLLRNMTLNDDPRSHTMMNICRLFNIYLGGYIIAAAGLNVHLEHGFVMFIHDVINGTLLPAIVGHQYSTTDAINSTLNEEATGTFFEMIIQAKEMFDIFFPVAILFIVYCTVKMDYQAAISNRSCYKMLFFYCGINLAVFTVMYTYTMTFNIFLNHVLPFLIFALLDRKILFKFNGKLLE